MVADKSPSLLIHPSMRELAKGIRLLTQFFHVPSQVETKAFIPSERDRVDVARLISPRLMPQTSYSLIIFVHKGVAFRKMVSSNTTSPYIVRSSLNLSIA